MQITIGMQNVSREISFETDLSLDEAAKLVEESLEGNVLALSDDKGRRVVVRVSTIAYVELGSDTVNPVGFLR